MTVHMQQPVQRLLSLLYQLLWVFPAYFISFLVSCSWYEEIASRTYALHFGKRKEAAPNFVSFVIVLRDEAWRCVGRRRTTCARACAERAREGGGALLTRPCAVLTLPPVTRVRAGARC